MDEKPYKESLQALLNAEVAPPHEIARLDRIMQYRNAEAMNGLSKRLEGVMETIHRSSQLMQEKADRAITQAEEASKAQEKHQKAIVALTIVLAISTLVYTGITAWSTYEQHLSNVKQSRLTDATKESSAVSQVLTETTAAKR